VAVKIKLQRLGKIRAPYYRVIVSDARTRRSGKAIETIGQYRPKEEPSFISVDSERAQYWLGVGAQPTEAVEVLLKVTGDWQKFKGLPGTEGTLKVAEPKRDKLEVFNEALKDSASEPKAGATTRKKKADKAEAPVAPVEEAPVAPAEEAPAAEAPVEAPAEEAPAAEAPAEEAPAAEAPAPVPASETPEGAAEEAEAAEVKDADADAKTEA